MQQPSFSPYQRFLPWKRAFEIGFWSVLTLANAAANSATVWMDVRRESLGVASWEVVCWEASSALMSAALVWPVVWFSRWRPLFWDTWRRELPAYVLFSLLFCVVHVAGMVAIREVVYLTMGRSYDFGVWSRQLPYEYLKDVRTFLSILALIELYRLLMRRWQGEASVLGVPDDAPALEVSEFPERFLVRKLGREFLVAAQDIEWVQAAGNYVNLRMRGHDYPLRSSMAGIEAKLDPARFVRIHRSYLVNFDQVASIEPLENGDARVHLKDGTALPCSRTYRSGLRERTG